MIKDTINLKTFLFLLELKNWFGLVWKFIKTCIINVHQRRVYIKFSLIKSLKF